MTARLWIDEVNNYSYWNLVRNELILYYANAILLYGQHAHDNNHFSSNNHLTLSTLDSYSCVGYNPSTFHILPFCTHHRSLPSHELPRCCLHACR